MAIDITMPRLSDQMEEGTVLRWLKGVGDRVERGEELVEIETDKATWIVEAEDAGTLLEVLVADGGTVPVGDPIAVVGEPGETTEGRATDAAPVAEKGEDVPQPTVAPPDRSSATPVGRADRSRATPIARRAARELGVDLAAVAGTGPGSRIVRRDVLAAAGSGGASSPKTGRGAAQQVPLTATQRTIARRMAESTASVPHFAVTFDVDMEAAVALRGDLKELAADPVPTLNDLVVKAVALALREHPGLNASFEGDAVARWPRVNVGVAVALDDALLVPVVHDADRASLGEIARATRGLVERAKARRLEPADLADGTFTVSNLGPLGARVFTAVVNPPEVAILAVGTVERRPVVDGAGALVARHRMEMTLSADHRAVYGADAARFLQRVRELLERPVSLTL